jgi:hypothetical protein
MREVLRGYAKYKDGISFLSEQSLYPTARTSRPYGNVGTKDIWSGKAQRSLRKRLLADRPFTRKGTRTIPGSPGLNEMQTYGCKDCGVWSLRQATQQNPPKGHLRAY